MNSPAVLIRHASLIARAIDISSRTRSGYYDCLDVARAERAGCELVSADQKSINNLAPHFPFIVPPASLPWAAPSGAASLFSPSDCVIQALRNAVAEDQEI